ncbi:hypothetical protein ES703_80066 [subsurface metagenome]
MGDAAGVNESRYAVGVQDSIIINIILIGEVDYIDGKLRETRFNLPADRTNYTGVDTAQQRII